MKHPFIMAMGFTALLASTLPAEERPKLSDAEQQQLQRDKVILTGKSYRQIFSPYVFSGKPVFITTDSVLNAWHVLLEDSIRTLEERFANDLPDSLDKALKAIPSKVPERMSKEVFESAARRARLVLGTASKLAGGRWSGGKELDDLIAVDVRHAEEAKEVALPEWLAKEGGQVQGFDYAAFRPAGVYTESKRMERYFRAVRWLQTVPFDMKNDDQLASMWIITAALEGSNTVLKISEAFGEFLKSDSELDAWSLSRHENASAYGPPAVWLERLKTDFDDFENTLSKPAVVLSARALPDLELFNKTTGTDRPFPKTLEAAALLGSPLAEKLLGGESTVLSEIANARTLLQNDKTLHGRYAACLADLFAAPEPDAPDFMKSEPWQMKSLNTCLAGWAQDRHAWALQGKENAYYFGTALTDPLGFVEPNPEFFRHLAALVSSTRGIFESYRERAVSSLDVSRRAADLLPLIQDTVEPIRKARLAVKEERKLSEAAMEEYRRTMGRACEKLGFFYPILEGETEGMAIYGGPTGTHIGSFTNPERLLPLLKKIADGENINEVMAKLAPDLEKPQSPDRWQALCDICHELETLAHKQLRGVEPAKDEVDFLMTYGEKLAKVMLYDGNSWEAPDDDAPRISAVFNQPGQGFLLAGVGRPQEIWVIYPWKGREIACRGAVMPFLEMHSDKHLTDAEWKATLDGAACPHPPAWLKPVIPSSGK